MLVYNNFFFLLPHTMYVVVRQATELMTIFQTTEHINILASVIERFFFSQNHRVWFDNVFFLLEIFKLLAFKKADISMASSANNGTYERG